MKKNFTLITSLCVALMTNAQTTPTLTQANHAPANGESFVMRQHTVTTVSPGNSGTNVTWNFGSAVLTSTALNYTVATAANASYPSANIAMGTSATNVYYLKSSNSALELFGGPVEVGSVKATFNYSSSAIWASYPMSMGTTSNATTGGSVSVTAPMTTSGTFTGTSNAVADGTGTLILPTGTVNNVLRTVSSQTLIFTLSVGTGTLWQQTYEYYGSSLKSPLLAINAYTLSQALLGTSNQQLLYVNKDAIPSSTTAIASHEQDLSINVFPQPASAQMILHNPTSQTLQMEIFDMTGKKMESLKVAPGAQGIDVTSYPAGIYIYKLASQDGRMSGGRLTVVH